MCRATLKSRANSFQFSFGTCGDPGMSGAPPVLPTAIAGHQGPKFLSLPAGYGVACCDAATPGSRSEIVSRCVGWFGKGQLVSTVRSART